MQRFNKLFRAFTSQVEFLDLSVVVAVQTRGIEYFAFWTTLFRLELSQDCVNFSPLLTTVGSNVVSIAFYHYCLQQRKYAMYTHILLLMNSFNKTEAAVFSCRLCFLRAIPFISLIYFVHKLNITYLFL